MGVRNLPGQEARSGLTQQGCVSQRGRNRNRDCLSVKRQSPVPTREPIPRYSGEKYTAVLRPWVLASPRAAWARRTSTMGASLRVGTTLE